MHSILRGSDSGQFGHRAVRREPRGDGPHSTKEYRGDLSAQVCTCLENIGAKVVFNPGGGGYSVTWGTGSAPSWLSSLDFAVGSW